MTTTKEELVAASIRKQIGYLEGLLEEMEDEAKDSPVVGVRIHDVEKQLRKLRGQMGD